MARLRAAHMRHHRLASSRFYNSEFRFFLGMNMLLYSQGTTFVIPVLPLQVVRVSPLKQNKLHDHCSLPRLREEGQEKINSEFDAVLRSNFAIKVLLRCPGTADQD
jgi:hypothetical protein